MGPFQTVIPGPLQTVTRKPDLPQLPRNRRQGLILIVDGTFLRAYAHQRATVDADGTKRFTDPSVTYGRRHPIDRYPGAIRPTAS